MGLGRLAGLLAIVVALSVSAAFAGSSGESRTLVFLRAAAPYAGFPSCPPRWTVMQLDVASGQERMLSRLPRSSVPASWSPDFSRLALWRLTSSCSAVEGLFTFNLATRRLRRLLPAPRRPRRFASAIDSPAAWVGLQADWSPDGRLIAAEGGLGPGYGLMLLDPFGRKSPRMIARTENVLSLAWAPDGSKIMYGRISGKYSCCGIVHTIGRNGRNDRFLVDAGIAQGPGVIARAIWAPSSHLVAYGRSNLGLLLPGLRLVNLERAEYRITQAHDIPMAWSPDGTTIAVSRVQASGAPQLVLVRVDGTGEHLAATDASEPVWSPDGQSLAYVSSDGTGGHLYLVDTDRAVVKQLTHAPGYDTWPHWARR
jgi:Tol biopolymer transport system component